MQSHSAPAATGSNIIQFPSTDDKPESRRKDKFFAVCSDAISRFTASDRLVDLLAFVVLASGTAKDHASTAWSGTSVARYLGISKRNAANAIERLRAAGRITSLIPDGKKASAKSWNYRLTVSSDPQARIWLPNALVDGAADEKPPLKLLMEIGDIRAALLLLKLYSDLDLPGCGGVDPRVIHVAGRKARIVHRSCGFTFYADDYGSEKYDASAELIASTYKRDKAAFWTGLKTLESVGLIMTVTHVRTSGRDAINLGPLDQTSGSPLEREISERRISAAIDAIDDEQKKNIEGLFMVRSHIPNPTLVGVLRPRYLPKTHPILAWIDELKCMAHDTKDPLSL